MNEIQEKNRPHHPFSPSSLQNREACPSFENTQSENEAAFFGTLQHTAVDQGLDDPRLSDARAVAVADCVAFAESRAALYPECIILREVYLPIDEEVTTAGYLDIAIISADETEAEIWDYKFGKYLVTHAKENLQGIAYLLGLKKKFTKLKRVKVGFIMPHADDQTEHTFILTPANVAELYLRVKTVVSRAIEVRRNGMDFSKASPNVGACCFCAHIGKCPAVAAIALKVGKKFAPVEIPDDIRPSVLNDPTQVAMGIKLAQIVKIWSEAYRAQATAKTIEDASFIPEGYQLVQYEGRTKVKDEPKVEEIARRFVSPEQYHLIEKLRDIPIGKLDDLISAITPRGNKEGRVKDFRDALAEEGATDRGAPYAILRQSQIREEKHE